MQRPALLDDERLQPGDVARQLVDEGGQLMRDERHDQHQRQR